MLGKEGRMNADRTEKQTKKIVMLGAAKVGKTSLMQRIDGQPFNYRYIQTHSCTDFISKRIFDRTLVRVWDTPGDWKTLQVQLNNFTKGASAIILAFDLTIEATLTDLSQIMNWIKENLDLSLPIILVGNKSDQDEQDQKIAETLQTFMTTNGIEQGNYFRTSAQKNENIDVMFQKVMELANNYTLPLKKQDSSRQREILWVGEFRTTRYLRYTAFSAFIFGACITLLGGAVPGVAAYLGAGVMVAANVCLPGLGLGLLALSALITLGYAAYQLSKRGTIGIGPGRFCTWYDQTANYFDKHVWPGYVPPKNDPLP